MQPAELGVERIEARRVARQVAARLHRAVGHLDRQPRRLAEGLDRARHLAGFGDLVQRELGRLDLDQRLDARRGVEGVGRHLAADADHLAEQGEVVDLAGEVARGDQRRRLFGQAGEVARAADRHHLGVGVEQRLQGDRRRRHAPVDELQDGIIDPAVERLEEVLAAELELDVLDQPVVDHQRAEQRRFRRDIVRQRRRRDEGERGGGGRDGGLHRALVGLSPPTGNPGTSRGISCAAGRPPPLFSSLRRGSGRPRWRRGPRSNRRAAAAARPRRAPRRGRRGRPACSTRAAATSRRPG